MVARVIVDDNVDVVDIVDVELESANVNSVVDVVLKVVEVDVNDDAIVVWDPAVHIVARSEGAAPMNVSFVGDWQVLSLSVPPQHFQEPSELS